MILLAQLMKKSSEDQVLKNLDEILQIEKFLLTN